MKHKDISGMIGELLPSSDKPEHPMYSFSRPAHAFWQGFYEGLLDRGLTHAQALDEMRSKGTRWLFDGEASDLVTNLGREIAKTYTRCLP